ncbi:MAG: hypothetical protein QG639_220 [Patescibacteria group bacterium]|nr:hypothetical protein [Patescibacteria group bacterium]
MKVLIAVLASFFYSVGQITLGLLLHPYQTMQSLVQDKVFIWMTLLPIGVYGVAKVIWHLVLVPTVRFVFSCSTSTFLGCDLIPFVANWLVLFCVYWQVLLLYLLLRFFLVFRTTSR